MSCYIVNPFSSCELTIRLNWFTHEAPCFETRMFATVIFFVSNERKNNIERVVLACYDEYDAYLESDISVLWIGFGGQSIRKRRGGG